MVLVQHDPIEAQPVGGGKFVQIFLIEADHLLAVEQGIGNGNPAALVFLVEIFIEIGPWHEMPRIDADLIPVRHRAILPRCVGPH